MLIGLTHTSLIPIALRCFSIQRFQKQTAEAAVKTIAQEKHHVEEGQVRTLLSNAVFDIGRPRFALVIGNGSYGSKAADLANPPNDVRDISERLERSCDFQLVKQVINQSKAKMMQEIDDFLHIVNKPELLASGRVVFLYFSGHGDVKNGKQQIVASPSSSVFRRVFTDDNIDINELLYKFEPSSTLNCNQTGLKKDQLNKRNCNIFVFDCCRKYSDNIMPAIAQPSATFIAFACGDNECAIDGPSGRNGEYTTRLLSAFINSNQVSFSQLFRKAAIGKGTIIDTTAQDFVFQYDHKFKKKVQKIQNEILKKEKGSIWNLQLDRLISAIWRSFW